MSVETDAYKIFLFLNLLVVGDVNIAWWMCLIIIIIIIIISIISIIIIDTNYCLMQVL